MNSILPTESMVQDFIPNQRVRAQIFNHSSVTESKTFIREIHNFKNIFIISLSSENQEKRTHYSDFNHPTITTTF